MDTQKQMRLMDYVLQRMILAGWIHEFGNTSHGAGLRWTDKRHAAAKQLRDIFDALGPQMTHEELLTLNVIVDTMSRYPRPDDPE